MSTENHSPLFIALLRLSTLQRDTVDRLALQEAVTACEAANNPSDQLTTVTRHLQVKAARWRATPDEAELPVLIAAPDGAWGLLRNKNAHGQWVSDWLDVESNKWVEQAHDALPDHRYAALRLTPPYRASQSPVLRQTVDEIKAHKGLLVETVVGGLLVAFLGVLTSLYSMQVYDRVIPTGATPTLLVLTLGIVVAIGLEYAAKRLRARLYERLIDRVDQRLARTIYLRLLSVRLDQLPPSVGSLANQMRGYESVRGFLISLTTHVAVDAPFAVIFVLVIYMIAGPLAYIPLGFFVIAILLGLWHGGQIRQLAKQSQAAANRKIGLLVESIEAAEIIKSGQGGWRMLGRWLATSDEAREMDLAMRQINEASQYRAVAMQQVSYVLLIATGAWIASQGLLTMGGLIACSILSGRVLSPVTQLSTQVTAWANVKAALQGLDALWGLEDDHEGLEQPVLLDGIKGSWRAENVSMSVEGRPVLKLESLTISPGEKIGILGSIGSGKTTLLRLLSGMYKPQEGRIWLDDVDLAHLSKPLLAEHMGYLPQEGRLFGGTLRDNLLIGLKDPGDETILGAAKATGLHDSVIASHPNGLQQEIHEGGTGLSGGQKQLVNLTRVFLRRPSIWLLDEPTASLDRTSELHFIRALKETLKPSDNLLLVTHKPEMLQLVNRIVVIAKNQIVLDGPREAVLARLQGIQGTATKSNSPDITEGQA